MKIFCFHCECFHFSGECAFTVKPTTLDPEASRIETKPESIAGFLRRIVTSPIPLSAFDWEHTKSLLELRRAFEAMDEAEDEIEAQDCVFLWQCGIKADF